jgi:hypothetical protein
MPYTMKVVEIETGYEHELPADTVSRDEPGGAHGPLVPLGFRPRDCAFYVFSERWPQLAGKPLRVRSY